MDPNPYIERFIDLTKDEHNRPFNVDSRTLRAAVREGDATAIGQADGQFAIAEKSGKTIRLARTLSVPMRYFLAKRFDGPYLVVAHRIADIRAYAAANGLLEQFHPAYTRMVPAHYLTELQLIGCPDPEPGYTRFLMPNEGDLSTDIDESGRRYVEATGLAIENYLQTIPADEPVGVAFSGGIDSTAVFLLARDLMKKLGRSATNLRAFTLSIGPDARDAMQAVETAAALGFSDCFEVIQGSTDQLDPARTVRITEDYQPLDIQCGAVNLSLLEGIRRKHPDWRFLLDGDGGDENLKDYPLEHTDITIRSVINHDLLYQEGWGVHSAKHSQTYSGGYSRSVTRTFAPQQYFGFTGFSPFTVPTVLNVAESIPFAKLTDYEVQKLYDLKGRIVAAGVKQVLGIEMPTPEKRRFQHGAMNQSAIDEQFPLDKAFYRKLHEDFWRDYHEMVPASAEAVHEKVNSAP
jgi:asparagine synthase (glutamine-hydrolysing)